MYEKQSTRERRQQTYELIETVLRPYSVSMTLCLGRGALDRD